MPERFEPLEDLKLIFECAADAVLSVDRSRRITYANHAAEDLTGFPMEQLVGKFCFEAFRSFNCDGDCPIQEAMDSGHPVVSEYDIQNSQNRKVPVSVSAAPLFSGTGKMLGAVQTFRNLSRSSSPDVRISEKYAFCGIVSRNPGMRRLFEILPDIADSEATVLIQGESGAGKELFARALHQLSSRRDGPLVVVNCGAFPEPLLEAEIFGVRKGAYTDATENRPGRLEMAEGGTLLLDEIGDLPLPLQVKLLRVLENHEYQPLGAKNPRKADVRFLAATNCNLESMVANGSFRRDLYFRIKVVSLDIPPLRQRREDIPLLGNLFRTHFNKVLKKNIEGIHPEACRIIQSHDFPGNVRELYNVIERSMILCRGDEIEVEHLPPELVKAHAVSANDVSHRSKRPSIDALNRIMNRHEGKVCQVAQELNVDRTTVWRWLKQMEIHPQ